MRRVVVAVIVVIAILVAACSGGIEMGNRRSGSGNRGGRRQTEAQNVRRMREQQARTGFAGDRLANPAPAPDLSFLRPQQQSSGGTSYSGGGGGGGGRSYNYATDPTYQAYIRSLDVEEAQRRAETQQRRAYLESDRDFSLSETSRQGDLEREDIGGAYEDRGLFLGGGRLRDQARSSANQLSREGRIRTDTSRGISDLETSLARYLADVQLRRQQAAFGIF